MSSQLKPVPTCWVECFGQEPTPQWLAQFETDADDAVDALLTGRAYLGHLNVAQRDTLIVDFVECLGDRAKFTSRFDDALARWVNTHWGNLSYLKPTSLADTWQTVLRATTYAAPNLAKTAHELRQHASNLEFLTSLTAASGRNLTGGYSSLPPPSFFLASGD